MDDDFVEAPNLTQDEAIVDEELLLASEDFDASLRAKFSDLEYKKLRTIGAFIMRGLPRGEASELARVLPDRLETLIETNVDVAAFIRFKEIAYKASLLNTLTAAAISGRHGKSAGWLLEKQFRNGFGKNTKDDGIEGYDPVREAIDVIRSAGDTKPLVDRARVAKTSEAPSLKRLPQE